METLGFTLAIIVSALYAALNKVDEGLLRFLSKEEEENPVMALTIFSSLSSLIMVIILGAIEGKKITAGITELQIAGLMMVGLLTIVAIILYLIALNEEEASVVIPVFQTIPVFGYLLGWILMRETLSGKQLMAGGIIIAAAMYLSVEFGEKRRFRMKAFLLMIGSSILYALADTLFRKLALEGVGYLTSSFWRFAGYLSLGPVLCLVPKFRNQFFGMIWRKKSFLAINLASEGSYMLGEMIVNWTLLLAPVSIILLGLSFQPAWVLFFSVVLTKCWPKIYSRTSSMGTPLFHRAAAVIIMIIASRWV